jgi:hypothetical protein
VLPKQRQNFISRRQAIPNILHDVTFEETLISTVCQNILQRKDITKTEKLIQIYMGVNLLGSFPACEELMYLYEMLILIRMFRRFNRNTVTSVRLLPTVPITVNL